MSQPPATEDEPFDDRQRTDAYHAEEDRLVDRLKANPQPALLWSAGLMALVAVELGALMGAVKNFPWNVPVNWLATTLPGFISDPFTAVAGAIESVGAAINGLPTLLTREIFANQGYFVPPNAPLEVSGWQGTFLGLSPVQAWLLRVALVYLYAFVFLYWLFRGYLVFRRHYRYADWSPTDDIIDRMRGHNWGLFGLVVVVAFLVLAVFAPALGPTTSEQNIQNPYSHEIKYYDEASQSVETALVGTANLASKSVGARSNVGLWEYDKYGRFHPVGTLTTGKDLMTYMAYGARVSLVIALLAAGIAGGIALLLAVLTAYYKGLADLAAVLVSDSFMAMPQLLVLIMLMFILEGTWIDQIYSGAVLMGLIFGIWGWMGLWRAVRGPAFQIVESEWIDAAESFGERPTRIVRKHVMPYVIGYLLIYLSMTIGSYIIGAAALSFLGLGVEAPTPEWGRAVDLGQTYITTASWHISIVPGIAITLLVLGFNAFGDGIRDAIDPQSEGASEAAEAGGTGA